MQKKNGEYKEALIEKTQHFVRLTRFKSKFFEDENVAAEEYDTYGFKTKRSPKPVDQAGFSRRPNQNVAKRGIQNY